MSASAAYRTARELGVNPRRFGLLAMVPRYIRDLREWRRRGGHVSRVFPVLSEWTEQAGNASGAYFHQDLLVAREIYKRQPRRHIDVGSRIDGFVAHVAVFREIEVIDIRPMAATLTNIRFLQADFMNGADNLRDSADSVSCLHALEHFGLGRYGDAIDPQGHLRGFCALVDMLQPGGDLYLSFPIGRPGVEFNAHRVFDCLELFDWPAAAQLRLRRFDYIDDAGALHENIAVTEIAHRCRLLQHGCGIYTFEKLGEDSSRRTSLRPGD